MKQFLSAVIAVLIMVSIFLCGRLSVAAQSDMKIEIRTPSVTAVNYGDTLILHADLKHIQLPDGYSVVWSMEGDAMFIEPTADGLECYVTSAQSGTVTIKATVMNENNEPLTDGNGNEVSDTQELKSRGGFLFRLLFLIRRIFLYPKLIPESV